MNRFAKGMVLGIGIGLLVAPMKGEELRNRIGERLQQCKSYLPAREQFDDYKRQISERVTQTTDSLKSYAQQAASTVKTSAKSTASNLSEIAQNATSTIMQTGKDTAAIIRDTAKSDKTDSNV